MNPLIKTNRLLKAGSLVESLRSFRFVKFVIPGDHQWVLLEKVGFHRGLDR